MADITVFESRHRITYTPTNGRTVVLLDVGEPVDAEPAFDGGPKLTTTELIGRRWIDHRSTGNAEVQLTFDCHRAAAHMAAAQAMGLERWRFMLTNPQGVLRFQTAFLDGKTCPAIDWQMRASLTSVQHSEENVDTSPFATAACCHLNYEFTVSLPDTNDFDT